MTHRRAAALITTVIVAFGVLVAAPSSSAQASAQASRPVVTGLSVHDGSARGGTRLSVYGHSFDNVRAVVFSGRRAAAVTRVSSTLLRVSAPNFARYARAYVYVQTSAGTSRHSAGAEFTFHRAPAPVVRALSRRYASSSLQTRLRVYGYHFYDVYGVQVGTQSAYRVYRRSDRVLDVVLDPQQDPGHLRVVTRWGTSDSNAASAITFADSPMISSISTHVGSTGGGTEVTIYGSNFDRLTDVAFGSATATHVVATSSSEIHATTPAHPEGQIHAIVTTRVGSSDRGIEDRFRYGRTQSARWSAATEIDPHRGDPTGLSCPTVTFCVLIDRDGVVTYDGSTWRDAQLPVDGGWAGVECHSIRLCIAWSYGGDESVYDGATWSPPAPLGPQEVRAVDCTSDTFCRLFDTLTNEYVFDGRSFTPTGDSIPEGIVALHCTTETDCIAPTENGSVYRRTSDGWSASGTLGDHDSFYFASCPDDGSCLAVAYHGRTFTYDGTTWHETPAAPFFAQALSCASVAYCMAIDGNGAARVWTGGRWGSAIPVLDSRYPVVRPLLACSAEQSCLVVDNTGVLHQVEDGVVRSDQLIDGRRGGLVDISCPSSSSCVALDQGRFALVTHDGSVWSKPQAEAGDSVSCPSTTFCMAVGYRWSRIFDGTSRGERTTVLDEADSFLRVSCAAASFCLATVTGGRTSTWDGRAWSAPTRPLGLPVYLAICPAAGECTALTPYDDVLTLHAGVWRKSASLVYEHSAEQAMRADCPTPSICMLVSNKGTVTTLTPTGASYTDQVLDRADFIDCATASSCVVANDSQVAFWDGSSWSIGVDAPNTVTGLSCPKAGHCVTTGETTVTTLDW